MDAASAQLEESDASIRRSETSSPASAGNGTGVFIPACILDGSALCDPVVAAKFPCRRQRRGSAPAQHCPQPADPRQQRNESSPSSQSDTTTAAPASTSSHGRPHGGRNSSRHPASSGHSTSAKNPFASTPKNIRQQQLLCNLMAAADCFTDAGAAPAGPSRTVSLDYGAMPPLIPGSVPAAGRASMDRPSMDMSSVPRVTSRTSLESYGWGYTNRGRNSCEVNRPSMDAASSSMRSSMDRASCWSGRPSVDSTFSAYGPVPPSPQLLAQQQQHQQAAATAAAAAAAAVAARASYEAALPPTPAGNTLSRMGMWQANRASCKLPGLTSPLNNSGFAHYSLDSSAEPQVAAAAAAAVSAMQLEQQRGMNLLRFDSSNMSNVSSSSMDSAPFASPARSDLAAAMAARRNQAAQLQLQQMIDSMAGARGGNVNATVAALAALTGQGIPAETAALMLMQAQNAADACANGQGMAPEAILFQQQLQQIMQANEMAAAASNAAAQAAAASQLYAAAAAATQQSEQRRAGSGRWRDLGYDNSSELYQGQGASLPGPLDATNLQQQLELLQRMQL